MLGVNHSPMIGVKAWGVRGSGLLKEEPRYTEQKENRPCFSHFLLLFFVSPGFLGLPAAKQAAEPEESSRLEASLETSRSG